MEKELEKISNKSIVIKNNLENENIRITTNDNISADSVIDEYVEYQEVERKNSLKKYGKALLRGLNI